MLCYSLRLSSVIIHYEIINISWDKSKAQAGKLRVATIKKCERKKKKKIWERWVKRRRRKAQIQKNNIKAVIMKVKMLSKIGIIGKIHLLFIWIMFYSWSLHKPFICNRGWLSPKVSMASVNPMSPWFTEPQYRNIVQPSLTISLKLLTESKFHELMNCIEFHHCFCFRKKESSILD